MEMITGNILDIGSGIICQQVNCANGYGAGLSGRIAKKYPQVEQAYRRIFQERARDEIFGICQPVRVTDNLTVVNIFAEWDYANAYETGIVSTDMDKLEDALRRICARYPDRKVHIPYKIGCGLAGGDWNDLCKRCSDLPLIVVKLPGTKN